MLQKLTKPARKEQKKKLLLPGQEQQLVGWITSTGKTDISLLSARVKKRMIRMCILSKNASLWLSLWEPAMTNGVSPAQQKHQVKKMKLRTIYNALTITGIFLMKQPVSFTRKIRKVTGLNHSITVTPVVWEPVNIMEKTTVGFIVGMYPITWLI